MPEHRAGQRTERHRIGRATVRIAGAAAIPAVLRKLGSDPAEVLAEAQVDTRLFDDPDHMLISLAALGRLSRLCVTRTGSRHFGLLVGQRGGLESLGLAGLLVGHSPDVATALRRLGDHVHFDRGGTITVVADDDGVATLSYDIEQRNVEAADQIGYGVLAKLFNLMCSLCGPDWRPIEVRFAHRKPEDVRPFRRFFRADVRFGAEQNALVFSADWLQRRLRGADDVLQRLLQQRVDAPELRQDYEFPEQVRAMLRVALMTGQTSEVQVAALFSMHSRSLSRRLQVFGIGFRELLDQGRFEFARQMLEGTALDIRQIAASLDYADASAFTRAFRRWSGTTPALWRARKLHAA